MLRIGSRAARLLGIGSLVALGMAGCVFDGNGTSGGGSAGVTPATPSGGGSATVAGTVYAGNVNGASVSLYAIDAQGQVVGSALARAQTNAQGQYTLNLTTLPSSPVIVTASGGNYASEADQSPQTLGSLSVLVPQLVAGANSANLSVLTSAIAAAARQTLQQSGGTVAAANTSATLAVERLLGLTAFAGNPITTAPDPSATSGDAWLLSALAGVIEQLRADSQVSPAVLYQALQDDISDGKLDGLKAGQPISLGSGGTLAASLFTTQFSGAANAYGAAKPVYAGATSLISGALQQSAQAAGIAIGSSGSIAPLLTQSGGTQLYFAARSDGLVQLDMSNPASPVASKVAAINNAVMTSQGGSYFSSLDGIVIDPTPIHVGGVAKVFALLYSYQSNQVVAVNLTDGVVAGSTTLNIAGSLSFSGATTQIAGGIADGSRGKIWLATGDGLLGVDPSNLTAAPVLIAQPANTKITENLGGDPARDIVYAPDYGNQTLVVFNLAEAKAYAMSTADWTSLLGGGTAAKWDQGGEIDGVALDSLYQVAVMTPEGNSSIGLVTYATPSGSTAAVGSIAAGARFVAFPSPNSYLSGSAVDPVSHAAMFVGEGSGLAVGVLDNPAGTNWKGFSSFVAAPYNSSYSFEPHDPHTVGAFNVGGKPYGFILQGGYGPYKVGVIDMNAWLAAPTASAGLLASDPMADASIVRLLTY
ncbi:MAG: hypothetical protein KGI35_01925 [Burkholderiales bacterium]|nr:hypothetical protein [Burkholderiales bacterium]